MIRRIMLTVLCTVLVSSCSEDDPAGPVIPPPNNEQHAFVLVVENREMFPSSIEYAWAQFRIFLAPAMSEFFGVPEDSLLSRDFAEVIDDYGEPWLMGEIVSAAGDAYDEIVQLSDREATLERMVDELARLSDAGYRIDLLMDLHATPTVVCFDDRDVPVTEMAAAINQRGIRVRALYQTCCYASAHLDEWETTGIMAACGSFLGNSQTIYAPIGFMKFWTEGQPYATAVRMASDYDIEQSQALDQQYSLPPGLGFTPDEESRNDSWQVVAGSDTLVTFDQPLMKRPLAMR